MAKEKPLAKAAQRDIEGDKPLVIRRGRVESVDLYEIKDSELDLLERGSPADLQLNFAIFLVSLAFSAVCTLATATFTNKTIETAFLVVSIVGILLGAYLLVAWQMNRRSLRDICARIRERMPPEIAAADVDEEEADDEPEAEGLDHEPPPAG
jgi:hypothetical protein